MVELKDYCSFGKIFLGLFWPFAPRKISLKIGEKYLTCGDTENSLTQQD